MKAKCKIIAGGAGIGLGFAALALWAPQVLTTIFLGLFGVGLVAVAFLLMACIFLSMA